MIDITLEFVKGSMPRRDPHGHKGSFGHLLSVCGSARYPGAAILAALGAAHMGTGLVTAAFADAAYGAIAPNLIQTPLLPLKSNGAGMLSREALPQIQSNLTGKTAVLLGCGLGLCGDTIQLTHQLLQSIVCPTVLDADGINAIAAHTYLLKKVRPAQLALTPHPGEMARLLGCAPADVNHNRETIAADFAREYGVVLALKGANTLVAAPDGQIFRNTTGNDGLAKGGSGDLLAGMIASLLAQGLDAFHAAVIGVFLHGLCADRTAARLSRRGMTALDCAEELKRLLSIFE
ncbi:MAG: NAD(P)H-hydrate dehydratase [Oscillospiraceae bacterium]|nr:NAD(P)H-hydrate dehydratase [Oscillospiraceae bacterium]